MIDVKIKKLNEKAVVPFKTYDKDFCYDVVATSCEEIHPNVYKYGIGLAFEIDRMGRYTNLNMSIDFRPRSSVWKTGMSLANCQGTIDELYHSEVYAVFYHVITDLPKYEVGDKIGQIKLNLTEPINFIEVGELTYTGRGGYGSTGLKAK